MNAKEFSIERIIPTKITIKIDDCSEKNTGMFFEKKSLTRIDEIWKEQKCEDGFRNLEKRMRKGAGKEYGKVRFIGKWGGNMYEWGNDGNDGEGQSRVQKSGVGMWYLIYLDMFYI